jgi:arsenate reductase
MHYPVRVLFLCTGNSARSQMAEAFLRSFGGDDFEVYSAGTEPKQLHPMTIRAMTEANIDVSGQKSKHLDQFLGQSFDYIITVCDRARDNCPTFPGDHERIHWSFEDPASLGNDDVAQYRLFKRVRNEIADRIRIWVAAQRKKLKDMGISAQA